MAEVPTTRSPTHSALNDPCEAGVAAVWLWPCCCPLLLWHSGCHQGLREMEPICSDRLGGRCHTTPRPLLICLEGTLSVAQSLQCWRPPEMPTPPGWTMAKHCWRTKLQSGCVSRDQAHPVTTGSLAAQQSLRTYATLENISPRSNGAASATFTAADLSVTVRRVRRAIQASAGLPASARAVLQLQQASVQECAGDSISALFSFEQGVAQLPGMYDSHTRC